MVSLIWTLVVILFVLWLLGWAVFHVAGALIHVLLLLAIIGIAFNLLVGRRAI
jgi:hypothetical protein